MGMGAGAYVRFASSHLCRQSTQYLPHAVSPSPGADAGGVSPSPGTDGGVSPGPGVDVGGVSPVPAQMRAWRAQSRRRCEKSNQWPHGPIAAIVARSPQTWQQPRSSASASASVAVVVAAAASVAAAAAASSAAAATALLASADGSARAAPASESTTVRKYLRGRLRSRLPPSAPGLTGLTPAHICVGTDWAHPRPHLRRD